MEYSIQRNFKVVHESITFQSYETNKEMMDESDAAFLSDDECSSIRVIFATVPIFWD